MQALNLRKAKNDFMFADSKNVSYHDFCEKYNQYSIEWLSVRAHAVTPLDQIQAALDFQAFENHLMVEGIYSVATFAHNQFLLDGTEIAQTMLRTRLFSVVYSKPSV